MSEQVDRVEIKIEFQNVEVPLNINDYISSITYTDEDDDNADDLQITFDDKDKQWLGDWLKITPIISTSKNYIERQVSSDRVINYVVKKGDTLWAIANEYLGSGSLYPRIVEENNIKNPNLIYPGEVFTITIPGDVSETITEVEETTQVDIQPKLVTAAIIHKNKNNTGKDVILHCGTFEVDSINASGPPTKVTLKATSIPYTSTSRTCTKNRAWENCNLETIIIQIANEDNLDVMYLAGINPTYDRKEQVHQSDIVFIKSLCSSAGLAVKVTDLTIVVYDSSEYENKPVAKTITYGSSDYVSYRLNTSLHDTAYSSCHIAYTDSSSKEVIESTFTPDSSLGTGQVLELEEKVSSTEEAYNLAVKRLREKNSQQFKCDFTLVGDVELVSGMNVELKGFQNFDRKYKIVKAIHRVGSNGYTTDISLEWAVGY